MLDAGRARMYLPCRCPFSTPSAQTMQRPPSACYVGLLVEGAGRCWPLKCVDRPAVVGLSGLIAPEVSPPATGAGRRPGARVAGDSPWSLWAAVRGGPRVGPCRFFPLAGRRAGAPPPATGARRRPGAEVSSLPLSIQHALGDTCNLGAVVVPCGCRTFPNGQGVRGTASGAVSAFLFECGHGRGSIRPVRLPLEVSSVPALSPFFSSGNCGCVCVRLLRCWFGMQDNVSKPYAELE
ncbi:hypothetical protein N9L68_03340 [bacterium]|nr:hypothetical protein [bacterium]